MIAPIKACALWQWHLPVMYFQPSTHRWCWLDRGGIRGGGQTRGPVFSHSATSTVSPGSDSQSKQYGHTHRDRRPRACKVRENFYAFEQLPTLRPYTNLDSYKQFGTCPMLGHGRRAKVLRCSIGIRPCGVSSRCRQEISKSI